MRQSYLREQYPKGKIRTALKNHTCNGNPAGNDPGCGGRIAEFESYFDTMVRNEFFQANRFCKRCAQLTRQTPDLFDIADNRQAVD